MNKGLFIVLYGINNLGKSTQAKLLVERMQKEGHKAIYLKYPIYNLEPSGIMLNDYLRNGNPYGLSAREVQTIYALNRTQFEPTLLTHLSEGTHVVAEDYTGTGLSWGIGAGVDEKYLKQINSHLLQEDISFLFTGERFIDSTEQNHKHETDIELLEKVRLSHARLGEEFGWKEIDASDTIQNIHEKLWQEIQLHLSR